jgi:hypothetical protein
MKELTTLQSLNNNKLITILPINKVVERNLNQIVYVLREQTYPVDLLFLISKDMSIEDIEKIKSIISESNIEFLKQDKDGNTVKEIVSSNKDFNYTIEYTDSKTFQQAFNEAFNYSLINNYEWFSVVEYLDVVDKNWYKNFNDYSLVKEGVDVFTPIVKQTSNGFFNGFLNETCWAEGFAEEAGLFDLQMLLRMNCINLSSAVLKTESIKNYSEERDGFYYPMKENFKITSSYEFFLRFVYNDIKIFTIPRIGYEYSVLTNATEYDKFLSKVPTNLLQIPADKGGITQQEYQFWIQAAKKEYFFDKDRSVEYKETA